MTNPFTLRELKRTDTEALLAFEMHNREWFESQIDPRDPAFYSVQGVTEHIENYLSDFARSAWHSFVIEDANGRIVGRANLKSIHLETRSAEVGYRVDHEYCGQGIATLALKHLIQAAQNRWALTQLVAYVFKKNAGSRKVLERCGFLFETPSGDNEIAGEDRFILSLNDVPKDCASLNNDGRCGAKNAQR